MVAPPRVGRSQMKVEYLPSAADHHTDHEGDTQLKFEGLMAEAQAAQSFKKRRPSSSYVYPHSHNKNKIQA